MGPDRSALLISLNTASATALAVGLPFAAFERLVLFHFYLQGGFVLDSGLLGSLLWHSDVALTQPLSMGGGSYFATHVSPLFWLASAVSRLLSLTMPQFFEAFVGFSHGLLALTIFWLLVEGFGLKRGAAPWLAAFAAVGFAFSALAIAIALYPHFETLIAAFFLMFAVAQYLGHARLACGFFLLGLATREDAGLHYFAVLSLVVAVGLARRVPLRQQRAELIYLTAALIYVLVVMTAQRLVFPGASAFVRIYVGNPPFAALGASVLWNRLLFFVVERPYVVWPALGAVFWALWSRNPYLLLGYAASVPWVVLNLLAEGPLAAALIGYYAFPLLIGMAWPLLAVYRWRNRRGLEWRRPIAGFAALIALSFVPSGPPYNPGRLSLPRAFLDSPSRAWQAATDHGIAMLSRARPLLGRLLVDNSVAALAPNGFTSAELPDLGGGGTMVPPELPDTVAYFTTGFDAARLRATAAAAGLANRYHVPGTPLHLAARRRLDLLPPFEGLLVAE